MKTKFTKVAVEERLPEKDGYYFTNNGYKYFFDILGFTIKTDWWLEESPDREDEMIEMLERIRNDIRTFEKEANQVAENFENSEMINSAMCSKAMARAYNTCNTKIESLTIPKTREMKTIKYTCNQCQSEIQEEKFIEISSSNDKSLAIHNNLSNRKLISIQNYDSLHFCSSKCLYEFLFMEETEDNTLKNYYNGKPTKSNGTENRKLPFRPE